MVGEVFQLLKTTCFIQFNSNICDNGESIYHWSYRVCSRVLETLGKFFLWNLLTFNNFNTQRNIKELKIQLIFNYIL